MCAITPVALHFARFRAFKEEARLPLAPLTIILGKNGSGKSVLTRLPVLISGGLKLGATSPLNLVAGGIAHAARFEDLVHQRSAQPFMVGAEIAVDGTSITFKTTLRHAVENHALVYESFEVLYGENSGIKLSISSPDELGKGQAKFAIYVDGTQIDAESRVTFSGLFPAHIEGQVDLTERLKLLHDQFNIAFGSPSYLGPFRSEAISLGRVPQQGLRQMGPRGEGALDILGDDSLRGDGAITRLVEDWFDSAMRGSRVVLELAGGIPRLLVHDPMRNLDVDLAETGAGFAQVLPIAVQVLSARNDRFRVPISIVEQPELHLHPGAHGALADLFVDAATGDAQTKYICETHSEQFVTRVRRRIAEGKIKSDDVLIVSIAHQSVADGALEPIRVIAIDEYGNTDTWPVGVFDEAFDDLIILREAVAAKGDVPGVATSAD